MNFKQWIRDAYGPESRAARAARRRKSRRPALRTFVPQLEDLEQRRVLATLVVNSRVDDTTTGDGSLTLREAILSVNQGSLTDLSTSAQVTGTFGDNDTIRFASVNDGQNFFLSTVGSNTAGNSAFALTKSVVIDGETGLSTGISIIASNSTAFRIFYVGGGIDVTLKGLSLSGGRALGGAGGSGDVYTTGGGGAGLGGAIFNQGNLTILDSTLSGNTAVGGAGGNKPYAYFNDGIHGYERKDINSSSGGGGMAGPGGAPGLGQSGGGQGGEPNGGISGLHLYPSGKAGGFGGGGGGAHSDSVSFISPGAVGGPGGFGGGGGGGGYGHYLVVDNAQDGGDGGFGGGGGGAGKGSGVDHDDGIPGDGGFGAGAAVQLIGGGGAGMGGAIFNEGGNLVITNSTITGNSVQGGAGGAAHNQQILYNSDGIVQVTNLTPSYFGNDGYGFGGGLFSHNGTVTLINSTIADNAADLGADFYDLGDGGAATATITNTIIAQSGDFTPGVFDLVLDTWAGGTTTVSGQTNLIRDLGKSPAGVTDNLTGTITTDPLLGALQLNGGVTPTRAPGANSPAINAGTDTTQSPYNLITDQRGVPRNYGNVDIGAYEVFQAFNLIVSTAADETTDDSSLSLREAVELANGTLAFEALSPAEQALVTPTNGGVNTITFAGNLNGSTLALSTVGDTSVGASALLVFSSIVINGPTGNSGIELAVTGATPMRLFNVTSIGNLTLQNLTLSGGQAIGANPGNDGMGGAIYNRGRLTIRSSTLTGNTARGANGDDGVLFGDDGGDGSGGAIFNEAGSVAIKTSTFYNNSAIGSAPGTGFFTDGDPGLGRGGGLFNHNGTVTVTNSTFSKNNTRQYANGTLFAAGRGIYNFGDASGVTANISILSTIIGQGDTNVEDFTGASSGDGTSFSSGGDNLIRSKGNYGGDAIASDPLLGPLQNNGGPTPTMALVASSPAINEGSVSSFTATDQRGVPIDPFKADIGAYERISLHVTVNTTVDETTDASTLSLREAVSLINGTLNLGDLSAAEQAQVTTADTDSIDFASKLYGSTLTLAIIGDSSVGASALLVSSAIAINGPSGDSGITLSATGTAMRLFHVTGTGKLTLQNLTLTGGTAQGANGSGAGDGHDGLGGAIYNQGTLTILNDTLTGNTAQGGNGGISGGVGGDGKGGAIYSDSGATTNITNSTVAGNTARGGAGGDGNTSGQGVGGGLYSDHANTVATASTISGNTADDGGRGMFIDGGGTNLDNTILAQSDTDVTDLVVTSGIINGGFDLIGAMSLPGATLLHDTVSGDPKLGPLQDNGGPTPTMALLAGSAAIDAGLGFGASPPADQRGILRVGPTDIGAYEARFVANIVVNTDTDEATDTDDDTLSLREAIGLANGSIDFDSLSAAEQAQVTPVDGVVNTISFANDLSGETITLSVVGDSSVGPSAFLINSRIVIDGASASGITLSAAGTTMRLFDVASNGNLTLQSLTLSGGEARGFKGGDTKYGNPGGGSAGLGGAIFNQGTLAILNSTLTGNTAQGGAGGTYDGTLTGLGGGGGAGLNADGGTPPSNNYGSVGGGPNNGFGGVGFATQYFGGTAGKFGGGGGGGFGNGVNGSSGSGGAGGFGGGGGGAGAYFTFGSGGVGGFGGGGGAFTIYNAVGAPGGFGGGASGVTGPFDDSRPGGGGGGGMGGAIFNEAGTVVITNSTFALNAAIGGAGGAGNNGPDFGVDGQGLGGGLFNHNGVITVVNSTFSANTAADGGRGIFNLGDSESATTSSVTGQATITDSIIGQSDTGAEDFTATTVGTGISVATSVNNLIRTHSGIVGTFASAADPKLAALANNGGPTPTMALESDSPAIDSALFAGPNVDQRGVSRIGLRDLGAFEFDGEQSGPVQVVGVFVDGSNWTTAFLNKLHDLGLGNGGYRIPVGSSAQLQTLPWVNLDQIQIQFSAEVHVQQESLQLSGVSVGEYTITGFDYNHTTHTATWTLSAPIEADRLQIHLASSGAAAVTDLSDNPLDGEWTDQSSVYPSGDGESGGNFDFAFNVLPGDVNQDGIVGLLDLTYIGGHWHKQGVTGDANGDNTADLLELSAVASNWQHQLPPVGGGGTGTEDSTIIAGDSSPPPPMTDHAATIDAGTVQSSPSPVSAPASATTALAPATVSTPAISIATIAASAPVSEPATALLEDASTFIATTAASTASFNVVTGTTSLFTATSSTSPGLATATSSGAGTQSSSALSLVLSQVDESGTESVATQSFDRVAAFLGRASATLTAGTVDSLMSQHAGEEDGDFKPWSLASVARWQHASTTRRTTREAAAAAVLDDTSSSVDEDLLDALIEVGEDA